MKQAPTGMLSASAKRRSAYALGKDLFGPHTDAAPTEDIARHSARLLRRHFRGRVVRKRRSGK